MWVKGVRAGVPASGPECRDAGIGLLPPGGGLHLDIAVFAGNCPRMPPADDPNRAARTEREGRSLGHSASCKLSREGLSLCVRRYNWW
jgi:hypothetical protein